MFNFYQVLSRNNDVNGNPHRLVLSYTDGVLHTVAHCSSSRPNYVREVEYEKDYVHIEDFHLTVGEFNKRQKEYENNPKITFLWEY
jgi:hypothetical protein